MPWPVESFDHLGDVLRSPVPPVSGAPQELHDVLVRGLEPDVARRTPSAVRLRDELSRIVMTPAGPTVPVAGAVGGPAAGAMSGLNAVSGQSAVSGPRPNAAPWPVEGVSAGPGMTPGQPRSGPAPPLRAPVRGSPVLRTGVLATVVASGTWWATKSSGTTASPGGQSTTSTTGKPLPPPYLEECATGHCVAEPICYRGITSIGGMASTARRVGNCSEEHYWEAFAGGWLSGPIPKIDNDELVKAPEIANVCTTDVMKANTRPIVDTSNWEFTAVGFEDGEETYFHCLASPTEGGELTTSAFGGS